MEDLKVFEKFGIKIDSQHKFDEKTYGSNDWVLAGKNNDMFKKLYQYADYSPIHNVCLRSISDNVIGQGFIQNIKMNKYETINQLFRKIAREFIITGNVFLSCVWKNDRSQGLKSIYFIPSEFMRVGKVDDLNEDPEKYYYCDDWGKRKGKGLIEYNSLDPSVATNQQIYHIKAYTPGMNYYGQPYYMSVLNDVILNHEISIHHLSNIKNGANPSLWINFRNGKPKSQDEADALLRELENRYGGSENAGQMIVSFSDETNGPEITQIQTNANDQYYSAIFEQIQKQILSGHKITDPSLIGLPTGSGFSSQAEQLETAFKLFLNTTIKPIQNELIEHLEGLVDMMYPDEEINLEIIQNQILS